MTDSNMRGRMRRVAAIVLAGAFTAACHQGLPAPASRAIPFAFPEDDGNFRVTDGKRIDVMFPLSSRDFITCTSAHSDLNSYARYRSLGFYMTHKFPGNEIGFAVNNVTMSVEVRFDSATVKWHGGWSADRMRDIQTDTTFARFDSVVVLDTATVSRMLLRATLNVVRAMGHPALDLAHRTVRLTDAHLENGRLRFSVRDSAAIDLMLLPNNVSVEMGWCEKQETKKNVVDLRWPSQVTIERRP